jgi:hypothetical protein
MIDFASVYTCLGTLSPMFSSWLEILSFSNHSCALWVFRYQISLFSTFSRVVSLRRLYVTVYRHLRKTRNTESSTSTALDHPPHRILTSKNCRASGEQPFHSSHRVKVRVYVFDFILPSKITCTRSSYSWIERSLPTARFGNRKPPSIPSFSGNIGKSIRVFNSNFYILIRFSNLIGLLRLLASQTINCEYTSSSDKICASRLMRGRPSRLRAICSKSHCRRI